MKFSDKNEIIELTPQWTGEGLPDGRPYVADKYLTTLKKMTLEEVWKPIFLKRYENQFEGRLQVLHNDRRKLIEAVHTLLLALYGLPFIYNGYEVCDTNRHSIFYNRDYKGNMIIEWDIIFTEKGYKRYDFLKNMIKLRHTNIALTHGDIVWTDNECPDEIVSFTRNDKIHGQKIMVIINLSRKLVSTGIGIESYKILNERRANIDGNKINLLPFGWGIIELQGGMIR